MWQKGGAGSNPLYEVLQHRIWEIADGIFDRRSGRQAPLCRNRAVRQCAERAREALFLFRQFRMWVAGSPQVLQFRAILLSPSWTPMSRTWTATVVFLRPLQWRRCAVSGDWSFTAHRLRLTPLIQPIQIRNLRKGLTITVPTSIQGGELLVLRAKLRQSGNRGQLVPRLSSIWANSLQPVRRWREQLWRQGPVKL